MRNVKRFVFTTNKVFLRTLFFGSFVFDYETLCSFASQQIEKEAMALYMEWTRVFTAEKHELNGHQLAVSITKHLNTHAFSHICATLKL